MEIFPSTFLVLAAIAVLAARGPRRGLWAFMALVPFGAAAAFNLPAIGGASVGLKELAVLAVAALLLVAPGGGARLAGSVRPGTPGFLLLLLMGYAALSALFFPALFAGRTEVFSLSRAANGSGIVSIPLRPGSGNVTQLVMMILAALAYLSFATAFRARPDASAVLRGVAAATIVHTALGWLDVVSFSVGWEWLLDPIRTANYAILADHRMAGLKRMIGGYPEASAFGAFSLALTAFWLHAWLGRPRAPLSGLMLALSLAALLRSTSSGSYVAFVLFLLTWGGALALGGLRRRIARRGAGIVMGLAAVAWFALLALFAAYEFAAPVTAFLDRALFDKLATESGVERLSWTMQALRNFSDTFTFGAGLGSVRASNWLAASLGSIGLIGTALYLAFLGQIAALPPSRGDARLDVALGALKAACLALLIEALLTGSTPNLGVTFFTFAGLAAGLSRGAAAVRAGPRPPLPGDPGATGIAA